MSLTDAAREREIALLRDALRATTGDPSLDRSAQEGIAVGIHGDPELDRVFREETAPDEAALDLHLTGEGVDGHSANARHFAEFVARMSRTVKFTARSVAKATTWSENLLVDAPTAGSVRVILRAPNRQPASRGEAPIDGVPSDTPDSAAIRRIAGVITFASAEDGADADAMVAAARGLPPDAQESLKSAMRTVIAASWAVEGSVRQRWQREEPVALTTRGAERLLSALELSPAPPRPERMVVSVDGLKHSLSVVYLKRSGKGHAFAASVTDQELLRQAAHLAEDPARLAVAELDVFVDEVQDGRAVRTSHTLRSIRQLDPGPVLVQGELGPFAP